MDACQLIELAALVSAHSGILVRSPRKFSLGSLARYESYSRRRFEVWAEALARYRAAVASEPDLVRCEEPWQAVRPILQEIFTGDVLVRVWGGLLAAHDLVHGAKELEPIARRVLVGQIEANNRALSLLIQGHHVRLDQAAGLNRLRHRVERWTDLLLAPIVSEHGMAESLIEQFAVDTARARDFADDLEGGQGRRQFERAWPLVLASLRGAFQAELSGTVAHRALNAELASSVLACFPPDCFDATGIMHSSWLMRLTHAADDTPGLMSGVPNDRKWRTMPGATGG